MFYSKDQLKGFISEGLFLVSVKLTGCLENADHRTQKHRPRKCRPRKGRPRKRRPCKQWPLKHRHGTNTKPAFAREPNEFKSLSSSFLFLCEVCVFEVCGLRFRDTQNSPAFWKKRDMTRWNLRLPMHTRFNNQLDDNHYYCYYL
mgnify:CR=1 FL=1